MANETLSDDEIADLLHRMVFQLSALTGATTRGDAALKASRGALLIYLAALIKASETAPLSPPDPQS
jgi:hypothetical protein